MEDDISSGVHGHFGGDSLALVVFSSRDIVAAGILALSGSGPELDKAAVTGLRTRRPISKR